MRLNYIDISNCIVYIHTKENIKLSKYHLNKILDITLKAIEESELKINNGTEGKLSNLYNNFDTRKPITNYEYPKEVKTIDDFWLYIEWSFEIEEIPSRIFSMVENTIKFYWRNQNEHANSL